MLPDTVFGNRHHCLELIVGSEESIATQVLARRLRSDLVTPRGMLLIFLKCSGL